MRILCVLYRFCRRYMAEILPIRRKTLSNQSSYRFCDPEMDLEKKVTILDFILDCFIRMNAYHISNLNHHGET